MSASTILAVLHGRTRLLLQALLLTVGVVLALGLLPTGTASAAAPAVEQCNGSDNVGGQEVRCDVTVANTLDLSTGVGSSTVTVQECHGAAGAPTCGPATTTTYSDVTTAISQCNGSGSGGGGVVACTVRVTNTITGNATASPATVNQCNGSGLGGGTEPTVQCSPIGSTTSATITQCNDSGNGGGGTLRVRCTVDTSTTTSALPVTVNQCNGSGNGGGATVTCRASITNSIRAAASSPSPSATPASATPSPSVTASAAPTVSASPTASTSPTASASPTATPAASASPTGTPAPTPTAAPTPAAAQPSASATPAVTETPVPVVVGPGISAPVDNEPAPAPAPADVLPQTVTGMLTPTATSGDDSSVTTAGQLPRTGVDVGALTLLGLVLTTFGAATSLLLARTPAPVGRHIRPTR